jgi:DNA repair exonuclease SbcCD ATPase subunit
MAGTTRMILEGFEIENWACIRRLVVSGLPPTGVIVLHGPNRTGKSSLVKALRACLMDYKSDTSALKSYFPRGSGEKPTVSVTFAVQGSSYRIKKSFGTNKSELASQTSTGAWKVEATTAAEAHSRVCELAGGNDSNKGLRQLLWLTQAEFSLPDARKFDVGVQAQLRSILGVLQTPLDDQFIDSVKNRWSEWYSGQRKAGREQKIKEACKLAQNLDKLQEQQDELTESEAKFNEVEALLRLTGDLEAMRLDLERQLRERTQELKARQDEWTSSQTRIAARKLSVEQFSRAQAEEQAALVEEKSRADAARRFVEAQNAIAPVKKEVESAEEAVRSLGALQSQRRSDLVKLRGEQRDLQQRTNRVGDSLRALDDADRLIVAQEELHRAQDLARRAAEIGNYLSENPVPDKTTLDAIKVNRQKFLQLQADREAASLRLTLTLVEGACTARLELDGALVRELANSPSPASYSVRRKVELHIPAWGRIELNRGTSESDLDQIEENLQNYQAEFSETMASFGITPTDPDAFDQILRRNAEHGLKSADLKQQEGELRKLAPKGIEPLQRKVLELETKLNSVAPTHLEGTEPLPAERKELEDIKQLLDGQISLHGEQIQLLENEFEAAQAELVQAQARVTEAKDKLARCEATAKARCEELDRFRTEVEIEERIKRAKAAAKKANEQLTQSELTVKELTIDDRLAESADAVKALEAEIRQIEGKYNTIKGRLEASEGLHAKRSALSARVDELTRLTEAEFLESRAMDRLYELFEECREKQLGTLMAPINDRVLNWMRVLDIGDYKEMRFSDAFLPEKLIRRDGMAEFEISEESTGAQEQIGMLVRLALGSLLTSVDEPEVAVLDDPLTHCDVGRLNKMRAILRRASEGDSNLSRPAGPLQIIILTCHPEWFRDERATVIDLEDTRLMQRFAV